MINCLDKYRYICSLQDLQSSSPLVTPISEEVKHWAPLGQRGEHPIYSILHAGCVVCSVQHTPHCGSESDASRHRHLLKLIAYII